MRAAALLSLVLLAGCAPDALPAEPRPPEVVALGDSVPAGTACDCTPFPQLYAQRIGAGVQNLAVPGYTSQDVREQLAAAPARAAVSASTVVLVMAGANDLAAAFNAGDGAYEVPAAVVRSNLTVVVQQVHALSPAASVLILGYWNVVEDGDVARQDYDTTGLAAATTATTYCDDALRQAATAAGAIYVDTTAAFKGASGADDATGLLAADGDHPNAAGHRAIAEAAYAALPGG